MFALLGRAQRTGPAALMGSLAGELDTALAPPQDSLRSTKELGGADGHALKRTCQHR